MYSADQLKNVFDNQQLLIIFLCRVYFNKATEEDIRSFIASNTIDYEKFTDLCRSHGISSFLYYIISTYNIAFDKKAEDRLKQRYQHNQVASLEQLALSYHLQQSLLKRNITIIPYKGFVFSYQYYNNIGLRESSDMDFMIDENDADAVEQYMVDAGFRPKTTVPVAYREYYRKNFKDISYVVPATSKTGGYSAEMHWRLLNAHYGKYVSYDFFKQGIVQHKIKELSLLSLSPQYDLAAIVSNHFVKDLSSKFKYIIDVGCLLYAKGKEVDAQSFQSLVEQYGFGKRVSCGLFLVNALLGQELSLYEQKYSFNSRHLKYTLEYRQPEIKISSIGFLQRAAQLQDTNFSKLKFLLRCMYYYTLPMAKDIPAKNYYPIPFLVVRRLYHSAGKALQRSFGWGKMRSKT